MNLEGSRDPFGPPVFDAVDMVLLYSATVSSEQISLNRRASAVRAGRRVAERNRCGVRTLTATTQSALRSKQVHQDHSVAIATLRECDGIGLFDAACEQNDVL